MSKSISILDKDYLQWVDELIKRYQACQIRAAVKVNAEQLRFNWLLGHDIVEMNIEQRWGEGVMEQLSRDLKKSMPQTEGLSVTNLRYCRRFYQLYSQINTIRPQVEGETIDASAEIHPQAGGEMEISDSFPMKYGLFNATPSIPRRNRAKVGWTASSRCQAMSISSSSSWTVRPTKPCSRLKTRAMPVRTRRMNASSIALG